MSIYFEKSLKMVPDSEMEKIETSKVKCPDCNGTGSVQNTKCKPCSGSGYLSASWLWPIKNRDIID